MENKEFKSFGKIERIGRLYMSITQKLHGSNAQILIYPDESGTLQLRTGSRNRWLSPADDNFNFSKFVYDNKEEFISLLGEGRHFGEWIGPGINAGEGLKEKKLFLFNWRRWADKSLPERVGVVPLLYNGKVCLDAVEEAMHDLKTNGSRLTPGYMKPEGVVVDVSGCLYKKTFDNEEIAWKCAEKKEPVIHNNIDVSYLLQPLRLEKLLSKDEAYIRDYPITLPKICSDYVKDLDEERQFTGNEDEIRGLKKYLGSHLFPFVKQFIGERNERNQA